MKRSADKAFLEEIAKEIDAFPFDHLPKDLILKIFTTSGFTVKELHILCTLSKQLKKICTNGKVWEQILFKRLLGYEDAMKTAEHNKQLPEFMEEIRTSKFYLIWMSISNYEPFVKLAAIQCFINFATQPYMEFVHHTSTKTIDLNRLNGTNLYQFGTVLRDQYFDKYYEKAKTHFLQLMKNYKVNSFWQDFGNRWDMKVDVGYKVENVNDQDIILFLCFLLANGWYLKNNKHIFDGIPLACVAFDEFSKLSACACTQCQEKIY